MIYWFVIPGLAAVSAWAFLTISLGIHRDTLAPLIGALFYAYLAAGWLWLFVALVRFIAALRRRRATVKEG